MDTVGRQVAKEIRVMTRKEVIVKAIDGQLMWIQAADILGISARQLRRLKQRWNAVARTTCKTSVACGPVAAGFP